MLQRNSSKRLSLGHRKSTSSAHHKHESIDPEVARQQAQTAATLAFARANARKSTDSGISRHNSTSTYQDRPQVSRRNSTASENEGQVIRRQHSVRFAGPNAVPRRQAIAARASQHSIAHRSSSGNLRPRAVTTDAPVPAQYRPPSRSSSIGKASIGKGTNASFVTALAYDEYYTKEDDVASTPSSYRRIRKSKSMFSPLQAPSVYYTNGTPDSRFTRDDDFVDQSPQETNLRAPKSMSFLRGGKDHVLPGTRQRNDAAVQMARDKFLRNVEQQRLKAQPSFLFRSRKTREEKPFKKSLRTNNNGNGYGASVASPNSIPAPKESGFKVKARRASAKIKNKLKKVFGKENKDEGVIPNQQVEAPGTHVRKYNGDSDNRHDSSMEIPHPDDPTVSQVTSRMPSIHAVTSEQQLRSSSGSMRSLRSEGLSDDKSRVTSWATTTNNNTISSLTRAQNEADRREQQRLSIINEYGTHHSSATFSRRPVTNQSSAYPTITMNKSGKNLAHSTPPAPTAVDSARVYSALMKRLDENSPKAKLEAQRKNSVDSFISPKKVPPRSSSVERHKRSHSRSRVPATIRQVPPEFQLGEDGYSSASGGSVRRHRPRSSSRGPYNQHPGRSSIQDCEWSISGPVDSARFREHDDVFSPDRKTNENDSSSRNDLQMHHTITLAPLPNHTSKSHYNENESKQQLSLNEALSPQDIAIRNEPIIVEKSRKPLRDSRSTYFGSDAITLRKTTSPYRRALAEKDYNPAVVTGDTPVRASPLRNRPPLPQPGKENVSPDPQPRDDFERATYTESIYSRTTSGQTPTASSSTLVLPMSQHPGMVFPKMGTGDAVVLERATYRPTNPASSHRNTPSVSSTDWQGWMSSQIAVFEQEKNDNSTNIVTYALPTTPASVPHARGHVRENAQITDDDSDVSEDQKFSTVRELHGPLSDNPEAILTGPEYHEILQNAPTDMPYTAQEMPQRNISNFINQLHMQNGPNRPNEAIPIVERRVSKENAPKQQPLPLKPILKKPSTVSLVEPTTPRIPTPPPMPPQSPLKQMQRGSVGAKTPSVRAYTPASGSARGRERNVLHKRNTSQSTLRSIGASAENMKGNGSQVTLRAIDTPAKLVKKRSHGGSMRSQKSRENEDIRVEVRELEATNVEGFNAQQVGSKRMVDLFLNSRRRHITGSSEDSSGRSDGVFL